MADNITAPGRGVVLAAEDIGGVLWALSKLVFGDEGTATKVSAANPLPVMPPASLLTTFASMLTALQSIVSEDTGLATHADAAALLTAIEGTLAISAAALPLPAGAATAANQATGNTSLASILAALQATVAVSAASLPLPAGAATSANQAAGNTSLSSILTALQGAIITKPDNVSDNAVLPGWTGTAQSSTGYGAAYLEVTSMGTASSITVSGGSATANALQVLNLGTNASASAITAPGLYAVPAVGNLTYSAAGGTPTVNLIWKR